jgi:hypothetical protein
MTSHKKRGPVKRYLDTEVKEKRIPPKNSHGFAAFNFRNNTPKMRACDFDYVVRSKTEGVLLHIIEGKNRDEEIRFTAIEAMAIVRHLSGSAIRAFIFTSTSEKSWDDRAQHDDDDWADVEVMELLPQELDEIEAGRILCDELHMQPHEIKNIAQGRMPFESKIRRRQLVLDFGQHEV